MPDQWVMNSQRRARFVQEYLVDANGRAAAVRAGYAPAGAHVTASRLLRDPKVAAALSAGHAEKRAELRIDRQDIVAALQTAYDLAKGQGNPAAMVSAAREIGRLCGLYEPEKRVIATSPITAMLSGMTDAELLALVEAG